MSKIIELLFEKKYGEQEIVLFENRKALAMDLLTQEESGYFEEDVQSDPDRLIKQITNLQSYLSQLFTGSGTRRLSPKFRDSLYALIRKRLYSSDVGHESVYNEVINELEKIDRSIHINKNKEDDTFLKYIQHHKNAKYIAVFTSRPIELEAYPNKYLYKIRSLTIDAVLNYFLGMTHIQKYKFNFPNENLCKLFWRKLSLLILKKITTDLILEDKITKFILSYENNEYDDQVKTSENLNEKNKIENQYKKVYNFLKICNQKHNPFIQVLFLNEPVFIAPHIIFDPNEERNAKGYIFLSSNEDTIKLHDYSKYDILVWRTYVWDALKTKSNSKYITFEESVSAEVNVSALDLNFK